MFSLLVQFKQRRGYCNVPTIHKEGEDNLGALLRSQKK